MSSSKEIREKNWEIGSEDSNQKVLLQISQLRAVSVIKSAALPHKKRQKFPVFNSGDFDAFAWHSSKTGTLKWAYLFAEARGFEHQRTIPLATSMKQNTNFFSDLLGAGDLLVPSLHALNSKARRNDTNRCPAPRRSEKKLGVRIRAFFSKKSYSKIHQFSWVSASEGATLTCKKRACHLKSSQFSILVILTHFLDRASQQAP